MLMEALEQVFLGVECAFSGRAWRLRAGDDRRVFALAQKLGIPDILARLLAGRGVGVEDAGVFLEPTLRALLPDPFHLKDMDIAAERLAAAIMGGEQIAIFGDYDVDGATSSALLARFFAAAGGQARIYIPDRLEEGYGPNTPAMLKLGEEGASVIVTVDCGTTAFAPVAAATAAGVDVVILDHHLGGAELPEAYAIVNPNRLDETSPHRHLAAVGVAFLTAVAVNKLLRETGWYARSGRSEPDLRQWLDLVALGTVCDVVPLTGVNRAFVAQGLKILGARGNSGIAALADSAGITEAFSTYHLGFVLGPRVNAGGRVGEASLGARLLAGEGEAAAQAEAARRLERYNAERKAIEAAVLEAALPQAERCGNAPFICVHSEGWHPGVIGIVAGRLKEKFHRPAAVIGFENGIGKASARSIPGVNLGAAVTAAREAGLLLAGGGHAMAAGFTVEEAKVDALHTFLCAALAAGMASQDAAPPLHVDGAVAVGGLNLELVHALERAAPFGMGNPEPRLAVPEARVIKADIVGDGHIRLVLGESGLAGRAAPARAKGIAFRAAGTPLGEALLYAKGRPLHLAGSVKINRWQGRESVDFVVQDGAWAQ